MTDDAYLFTGDHNIGFYESDVNKVAVIDGGKKIWEGSITEYGQLLDLLRAVSAALGITTKDDG